MIVWAGLLLSLALLLMIYGAFSAFDTAIQPEVEKRSRLIASTVRSGFERALEAGVPLSSIAGADRYIESALGEFDEVRSITLLANNGTVIAHADRASEPGTSLAARVASVGAENRPIISLPILGSNTVVGEIRIGVDPTFIRNRLQDVLLDIFVIGLVAVLLAFELVIWVTADALGKPIDRIYTLLRMQAAGAFSHVIAASQAGNLKRIARRISDRAIDLAERGTSADRPTQLPQSYFVDIRLALFVFSTATEISVAFLPIYARDTGGPAWMSAEAAATAPLVAYLVAIAAVAPFSGRITRLFSPRKLFLCSIPLTAAAMIAVGLGQSAITIAVWHGAMALVYAVAVVACQEYAIRTSPKGERAQAIGSYLFVLMGGAFCGTALGGVLADRIGEATTFFVGAFLVICSGGLAALTISGTVANQDAPEPSQTDVHTGNPLRIVFRSRFLALVLGVCIPVNIGMSVFVWYLTPLILEESGARLADIGRTVMLFYLVPVLSGPIIARLADGKIGNVALLMGGTVVAGLALISLSTWSGFWPMVVVVSLFGLGYAMCDATQYAHAIHIAETSGIPGARDTALSALRLIERLGAIVGLVISAMLAESFGYLTLAVLIGMMMIAGAFLMSLAEVRQSLLARSQVGT